MLEFGPGLSRSMAWFCWESSGTAWSMEYTTLYSNYWKWLSTLRLYLWMSEERSSTVSLYIVGGKNEEDGRHVIVSQFHTSSHHKQL